MSCQIFLVFLSHCLLPASGSVEDTAEAKAVAAIEAIGGKVERDGKKEGKPVLGVDLSGSKPMTPEKWESVLTRLADCKQLRTLKVAHRSCLVTAAGLKAIATCTRLESLDLSGADMGGRGLKVLAACKQLRTLALADCALTDATLKELTALKQLHSLTLNANPHLTEAGLKELSALKELRTLHLTG